MSDNNTRTNCESNAQQIVLNSNNNKCNETMPKVYVEPCQTDFFYDKFKQSYPMFKNPRGLCLIVNIYQIDGMPPRRWSNRDTSSLTQLFEQLLFTVKTYTDSTHDLNNNNFKSILKDFAQLPEHEDAQSCVICLMSHGEEGYLTTKEGDKVLLDEIFTLFNNINCPNLAGKPKLFFIQSCRDDPISGPAEDLGIRLSFENKVISDESDGSSSGHHHFQSDNNLGSTTKPAVENEPTLATDQAKVGQIICHIPTLCDVLVGYPTQKGYIAYRKPEVGSWYMNAIVQVFSKHACDMDVCALLNMVNEVISNEVTNTGKKQMSEYTSKLTKPYFYFFPGLATETTETRTSTDSQKNYLKDDHQPVNKKQRLDILIDTEANNSLIENLFTNGTSTANHFLNKFGDQSDSNNHKSMLLLNNEHLKFVAMRANSFWKPIAREMRILNESQIMEIERSPKLESLSSKMEMVLQIWWRKELSKNCENLGAGGGGARGLGLDSLVRVLQACRLNKIKEELISECVG